MNSDHSDDETQVISEEEEEPSDYHKRRYAATVTTTNSRDSEFKKRHIRSHVNKPKLNRMADFIVKMIKKAHCLRNYKYVRYIGNGIHGIACIVTDGKQEYVVKVQQVNLHFIKEIDVMKKFSDAKIGVNLKTYCYIKLGKSKELYGLMVMEKIDGVLEDLLYRNQEELNCELVDWIAKQLIHMLFEMQRLQISHNDLHFRNIGYINRNATSPTVSPKNIELRLIDFGWGSDVRAFTDVEVLAIGRALYAKDTPSTEYMIERWWPEIIDLLTNKIHRSIADDYASMDKMYKSLLEKQVYHYRFIRPTDIKNRIHGISDSSLKEVIRRASFSSSYEDSKTICFHGLCTLKHKTTGRDVTIKFTEITNQSCLLWNNERMLLQRYYNQIQVMEEYIKMYDKIYGVVAFEKIDGTLSLLMSSDSSNETMKQIWQGIGNVIETLSEMNITYGQLGIDKVGYCISSSTIEMKPFDFSQGSVYKSNPDLEWLSFYYSFLLYDIEASTFWKEYAPAHLTNYTKEQIKTELHRLWNEHDLTRLIDPDILQTIQELH